MISPRRTYLLAKGSIGLLQERGLGALSREAALRLRHRVLSGAPLGEPPELRAVNAAYARWRELHAPSPSDLDAMRLRCEGFAYRPVISVIVPVFDVEEVWLRAAIESVVSQAYPYWELRLADDGSTRPHVPRVLKEYSDSDQRISYVGLETNSGISTASNRAVEMSSGEFIALLDHDDELAPDALYEVAALLNSEPETGLIYTDEDMLDSTGRHTRPYFKPGWSPDLLLAMNYLTHLVVCRRTLLDRAGGFRVGIEPGQDYDLVLRLSELATEVAHIPKVLYHWRSIAGSTASSGYAKPEAQGAAQRALAGALARRGVEATVEPHGAGRFRIRYPVPPDAPVSLVHFGSPPPESGHRSIQTVAAEPGQAWGRAANDAVEAASGEYLLLVGAAVSSAEPGWVEALLEQCGRAEVGVAGPRMIGSDRRVFSAGLLATADPAGRFAFRGLHPASRGYFGHAASSRNCTAVAGCLMVRRSVFTELGGFDPDLPEVLAEMDFCLRARNAGYRVICTPYATAHLTTSSRDLRALLPERTEPPAPGQPDPLLNPNLRMVYGGVELNLEPAGSERPGTVVLNESVACVPHPRCDLCKSEGTPLLDGVSDKSGNAPGRWQLRRCPECGLVWLNPRPQHSEIGKLYPESYFTHQSPPPAPRPLRLFRRAKTPVVRSLFTTLGYQGVAGSGLMQRAGRVLAGVPGMRERAAYKVKWATGPPGRLLDVGCGSGDYLALMRDLGWEVEGIEPDPRAVEQALTVHGLEVQCAVPEEGRFPAASFDLVTMIHVIEHVQDPQALMATCRRWLRPGGRLIVVTPNTGSLGRRWFGGNWFAWEVPRHLLIFAPPLLAETAERAGFEVERVQTCGLLARFVWEESSRIAGKGVTATRPRRLLVKAAGAAFGMIERLTLRFGQWGEEIVLIASNDPATPSADDAEYHAGRIPHVAASGDEDAEPVRPPGSSVIGGQTVG